jgi:hypothetical protein
MTDLYVERHRDIWVLDLKTEAARQAWRKYLDDFERRWREKCPNDGAHDHYYPNSLVGTGLIYRAATALQRERLEYAIDGCRNDGLRVEVVGTEPSLQPHKPPDKCQSCGRRPASCHFKEVEAWRAIGFNTQGPGRRRRLRKRRPARKRRFYLKQAATAAVTT